MTSVLLTLIFLAACPAEKPVYNYLNFNGPNGETPAEWRETLNKRTGMQPVVWFFHADLFPAHPDGGWDNSAGIDEQKFRGRLKPIAKGSTVVLNVETGQYGQDAWNTLDATGNEVNQTAIANRVKLLDFCRRTNRFCRYGYYGQLPRKSEGIVNGSPEDIERWRRWIKDMAPLADAVDFILPEVYPESDWSQEFAVLYLTRCVVACKDYYPDKPVYPLLWMEYMDLWMVDFAAGNQGDQEAHRRRLIPGPYWRALLEQSHAVGDGVMLWGGGQCAGPRGPWWPQTKEFLKSLETDHGRAKK